MTSSKLNAGRVVTDEDSAMLCIDVAANGHVIQKVTPCWRASSALGHSKRGKVKNDWLNSLCFGYLSASHALQQRVIGKGLFSSYTAGDKEKSIAINN